MLMRDIRRDERGIDRCNRQRTKAVPNVIGDPSQGYKNVVAVCGAAIAQRVSDGVRGCPHCDREPPVGNVHPRTMNSNDVALTARELQECKAIDDAIAAKIALKNGAIIEEVHETPAVEAKMSEIKKDVVILELKLEEIELSPDVVRLLVQRVVDSMDSLPTPTLKESKRLIKIQDRLTKLLEA